MYCARVSALTVLLVGLVQVHSFSWDIVVGNEQQLEFYNNGTLTHKEDVVPSPRYIHSVTYDPVHYRLLFSDYQNLNSTISSFDLSTRKIQQLLTTTMSYYTRVAYDPVTQTLFWKQAYSIHSFSLNPACSNKSDGNILCTMKNYCRDLAVDSCGRYMYWVSDYEIERARLDCSEREVLINGKVDDRASLTIDQQTQRMYWTERITRNGGHQVSIESASFNGKNRTTLYVVRNAAYAFSLAVSKDFIYWQNYNEQGIWQLPKYSSQPEARKLHSESESSLQYCNRIATNYTLEEQIGGVKNCDSLQALIPHDSTVSVCQNYCFQGECSASAEGHATCSCKAGYSGERCEVYACYKHCSNGGVCTLNEENKPVCQCTAGYVGERCDVYICNDYCLHQGNCSVGAQSQPNCSCVTGYSGARCEVNACQGYCLNGGVCSLNEEDEPACQCAAGYDGGRCEGPAHKDNSSDASAGERKLSACHQFCLHDGVCSLNEAGEPVCQCSATHEGDRCEVAVDKDLGFQLVATMLKGHPKVTVTVGRGVEPTCASTGL